VAFLFRRARPGAVAGAHRDFADDLAGVGLEDDPVAIGAELADIEMGSGHGVLPMDGDRA
jgi:hypothetical protein